MVSYYNSLPYSQKHSAANLAYSAGQHWQWPSNYPAPTNHQFIGEMDPAHQMYYNPHHMFHTPTGTASEWHSPTPTAVTDNYGPNTTTSAHQMLHQHSLHHGNVSVIGAISGPSSGGSSSSTGTSGSSSSHASNGPAATGATQLNETVSSLGEQHIAEGLPSPPITVSGSEISSPGAPNSSSSPHHVAAPHHLNNNSPSATNNNTIAHNGNGGGTNNSSTSNNNNNSSSNNNNHHHHHHHHHHSNNNRSSPVKAQYYDWMKKPSYPAQPTPGKTRTKDKYRVVYTDFQRLELEKEYCTSRYITIRRKTELAQTLSLSERQVKIWFQNRRAKERKQNKKGNDINVGIGAGVGVGVGVGGGVHHADYANLMHATKPKLEPELEHSLAVMGMPRMSLHQHWHGHHSLAAVSAHSAHQLQSSNAAQIAAAAAAGIGPLPM